MKRLLFAALLILTACSQPAWKKPTFTISEIRPVRSSLSEPQLDLTLLVTNPNDRGITAKGLAFDLKVDGRVIASSLPSDTVTLTPQGDTRVTLRVKGKFADLLPLLARLPEIREQGLNYELDGRVEDLNGLGALPFKKQGVWKPGPPAK